MVTVTDLPDPLVPAEVDIRDYRWMKLDITRLLNSDFNAMVDDTAWRCGVTLWMKAWHQVPAGSLPDDDATLCSLAGLGRDLKTWRHIRSLALHGFRLCRDGRLYHPVIAELVAEAWEMKLDYKENQERERRRKAEWREKKKALHKGHVSHGTNDDCPTGQPELFDGTKTENHLDVPCQNALRQDRDIDIEKYPPIIPPLVTEDGTAPAKPSLTEGGDRFKRGSRLPSDWQPSEADRKFAVSLELDPDVVAAEFCDYWIAQPGKSGVKLDWSATFRNRCRDRAERARGRNGASANSGTSPSADSEWEIKVRNFNPAKPWSWGVMSGPRPDQDGCYAPQHILEKYGFCSPSHNPGRSTQADRQKTDVGR